MLFNSFDFGLFLLIAFLVYWGIGSKRIQAQNTFLLLASYFFYAVWDWRFLFLLIASSMVDYYAARAISKSTKSNIRKSLLWISVLWNLGVLVSFKYFNFFMESFYSLFGMEPSHAYTFWNIAIPIGLSFYTFQTMGYTIDVYRKKAQASNQLLNFLCFVSFFPQLVAGPIERASKLLPQFSAERSFEIATIKNGLRQILWGLFKKIIVAEKIGLAVQMAFAEPNDYNFLTLTYAAVLFCFQVYCDFSGYTDIAIGTGKLLGFQLSKNFRLPYLAHSMTDFWQRWHITLTRWFTDYVYVPFVTSFKHINVGIRVTGLFITMGLVGLWHGAKWTFICFGIFNAILLMIERFPLNSKKQTLTKFLAKAPRFISFIYVFIAFTISAIFFRAASVGDAWEYFKRIAGFSLDGQFTSLIGWKVGYLLVMVVAEMIFRHKDYPMQSLERYIPRPLRWSIYYLLIFIIIRYAEPKEAFIYFQF